MVDPDNINRLADEFLDIWQENIRLWSVEKELMPLADLLKLVRGVNSDRLGGGNDRPD